MNKSVPFAQMSDWSELIRVAAAHPGIASLRQASLDVARGVLAAPAAVAYWIANSERPTPDALRLLIVGAEKLDAVDEGRWYQLIPTLLGRPMEITVTLIGDRLNRRFDSPLHHSAPQIAAAMHVGRLADFFEEHGEPDVDVAFLFHPGFQKHRGWLEDGSLKRLHARGIPVVVLSYGADESEIERWVVGCHGFDSVAAPLLNPFYIDFSDARSTIHWARAMWQFWPRPGMQDAVDQARLDVLDVLGDMVLHSIDLGCTMRAAYGQTVELKFGSKGSRRFIYVFDDYLVDPGDGSLHGFEAGQLVGVGTLIPADLLAYPGPTATDLARAVWAADVKSRYLLDRYPRRISSASLRSRARGMHADLEDKVDRLFRVG